MPHFFFHVRGACQELSRDELGLDFPDVETAYRETFSAARISGLCLRPRPASARLRH